MPRAFLITFLTPPGCCWRGPEPPSTPAVPRTPLIVCAPPWLPVHTPIIRAHPLCHAHPDRPCAPRLRTPLRGSQLRVSMYTLTTVHTPIVRAHPPRCAHPDCVCTPAVPCTPRLSVHARRAVPSHLQAVPTTQGFGSPGGREERCGGAERQLQQPAPRLWHLAGCGSEEHFEIAIAGSSRGSEEPLPPPGFADFARQNLIAGGCPGPGVFECYLHAVFTGLPAAVTA